MSIYLDQAATSFPKPPAVRLKVSEVLRRVGANPGRSDHRLARRANQVVAETRERVASFFGVPDAKQVIFTSNATEAINLGLKGILSAGDHVFTSAVEHNAVMRPLKGLEGSGVTTTRIPCSREGFLNVRWLRKNLKGPTKLIVLTHASNVTGAVLPVAEVGALARSKGILFMVDAAQTAGLLPIHVQEMKIDLLACPGHKSLYGPQGTGFLYAREGLELRTLKEGGTGTDSESEEQPAAFPDRFESGTLNTPGIAGLGAGISFIQAQGLGRIRKKERSLTLQLLRGLKKIKGVRLYGPADMEERVSLVSFRLDGLTPAEVAFLLDDVYDIFVRAGLHCAPRAHQTLGTFPGGTVRVSLGYFNTPEEIRAFLKALAEISRMRSL